MSVKRKAIKEQAAFDKGYVEGYAAGSANTRRQIETSLKDKVMLDRATYNFLTLSNKFER